LCLRCLFAVFKLFLLVEEKYRTVCLVASSTQYNLLTSAYTGCEKFVHMWHWFTAYMTYYIRITVTHYTRTNEWQWKRKWNWYRTKDTYTC